MLRPYRVIAVAPEIAESESKLFNYRQLAAGLAMEWAVAWARSRAAPTVIVSIPRHGRWPQSLNDVRLMPALEEG